MQHTATGSAVLGDLLQINKDCFTACLQIIENNKDRTLYLLLEKLVDLERDISLELREVVDAAFGDPAAAVEKKGEIYRSWQENAALRFPAREKDICSFCERKLQAIYTAYERALNQESGLPERVISMLILHVKRMKELVDCIRQYKNEKNSSARNLLVAHY